MREPLPADSPIAFCDGAHAHVVAVDVGRDQLRAELRRDSRVTVFEGLDISRATAAETRRPFRSRCGRPFIRFALRGGAGPVRRWQSRAADVIVLVKPQFEVGKTLVGRGVVGDPALRQAAVEKVTHCFETAGLDTVGKMESPITGEHGNQEYLLWARKGAGP